MLTSRNLAYEYYTKYYYSAKFLPTLIVNTNMSNVNVDPV